jgi:hypothetical protein
MMKRGGGKYGVRGRAGAPLAEYLFTGVAVLPATLTWAGHFDAALLLFMPLLLGACLTAAYEDGPSD